MYVAQDKKKHDQVAIKVMRLLSNDSAIENESKLMKESQSRYIVQNNNVFRMNEEWWVSKL